MPASNECNTFCIFPKLFYYHEGLGRIRWKYGCRLLVDLRSNRYLRLNVLKRNCFGSAVIRLHFFGDAELGQHSYQKLLRQHNFMASISGKGNFYAYDGSTTKPRRGQLQSVSHSWGIRLPRFNLLFLQMSLSRNWHPLSGDISQ